MCKVIVSLPKNMDKLQEKYSLVIANIISKKMTTTQIKELVRELKKK